MHDPIFITEEIRSFREQVARFVNEQIVPFGDEWEEAGFVPRDLFKRAGELGFLGLKYEEEYGGSNLDSLFMIAMAEELGKSTYGGAVLGLMVHAFMASPYLYHAGSNEQKDKYFRQIVNGEIVTAIAMTEPDAGSDLAGMKSRAVKEGREWVLNGSKMFITNGVHGDLFFVAAKTDVNTKGSRGISMFIVEKDTPGFSVGRALKKTGWWSSDTAELVFNNCRIPEENLLGELNKGFYALAKNLQNERLSLAGLTLGECQKALQMTIDYARDRRAFGGVLWDNQVVRHKISQLAAEVEAARQLTYHTAWLDSQGKDCVKETSMLKALLGELVNKVMYSCVQIHGGMGCIRETAIERMSRDARVHSIGGGATEVMLEEVAKRL